MIIYAHECVVNSEECGRKCPWPILSVHYSYIFRVYMFNSYGI